jgi:hypothetical protein
MITGGCDSKTGKRTSTGFTFAEFSLKHGLNFQSMVNGREIQMEVLILQLQKIKKQKK